MEVIQGADNKASLMLHVSWNSRLIKKAFSCLNPTLDLVDSMLLGFTYLFL